jgi:GAF domain-containing protein
MKIDRLIQKKSTRALLIDFCEMLGEGVQVVDAAERSLFGNLELWSHEFPFWLNGDVAGHVRGSARARIVANTLQNLLDQEGEKRSLARETLEKYKEISLLYGLAEKIAIQVDPARVARMVLDEVLGLIKADNASVMLLEPSGGLTILAGAGTTGIAEKRTTVAGTGISGAILKNGRAEIVNDAPADPRYVEGNMTVCSLMCTPLRVFDKTIGVINVSTATPHTYTAEELKLLSSVASQAAAVIENARLYDQLQETFFSTVHVLAETIEMRDHYTGGHTRRVQIYTEAIGQEFGLPEDECDILKLASSLHDIGKIGIDDHILRKPGRLSDAEFAEIKRHSEYGAEILAHVKGLRHVVPIVRHHHERYDGQGYPDGLRGEEIPLLARIITVADAFDAMIIDRPYRGALPLQQALEELDGNRNTQFDSQVVEAFFQAFHAEKIKL